MLQSTDPEMLGNKMGARGGGGMYESRCEEEIEWTLSVDGEKDLERRVRMGTGGIR